MRSVKTLAGMLSALLAPVAVAEHEQTGHFYAELCGDDLAASHGSLGRSTPRSTRLPVVVFLERAPVNIYVRWSIAE
jgi:hypothetical protein